MVSQSNNNNNNDINTMHNNSNTTTLISRSEQRYILDGCRDNCRQDGRTRDEVRCYSIIGGNNTNNNNNGSSSTTTVTNIKNNTNNNEENHNNNVPLILSNGSARLVLGTGGGETHILCSIKAELVQPAINNPYVGVVELYVDTLQSQQKGSNNSSRNIKDELTSTLSHLLVPHLVNTKKLCIVPYHYVWKLHIDLFLIELSGGSIIDSCSHVIKAALLNTILPSITPLSHTNDRDNNNSNSNSNNSNKPALQVNGDITTAYTIPGVINAPIVVTVTVLKCPSLDIRKKPITTLLLDATLEEEACAFARVYVAIDNQQEEEDNNNDQNSKKQQQQEESTTTICAIQKVGGGSLPFGLLQDIISFAMMATTTEKKKKKGERKMMTTNDDQEMEDNNNNNYNHHLLQEQFIIQQQ